MLRTGRNAGRGGFEPLSTSNLSQQAALPPVKRDVPTATGNLRSLPVHPRFTAVDRWGCLVDPRTGKRDTIATQRRVKPDVYRPGRRNEYHHRLKRIGVAGNVLEEVRHHLPFAGTCDGQPLMAANHVR